jgi:hypothetical protein
MSDLYIPRIDHHISLLQSRKTDPGKNINLSQIYECRNWEFYFWEYINGNQTFIAVRHEEACGLHQLPSTVSVAGLITADKLRYDFEFVLLFK